MQPALTGRALHVHCGDHSADTLRRSGVPGTVVLVHDPVAFGPAPAGVEGAAWYRMRAEYLASTGVPFAVDGLARDLEREDARLDDLRDHDELVLWFDHCLFDQGILIRLLDRLGRRPPAAARVSLLCIGQHPDFPRFRGLGELSPAQMAALADARHAVTPAETRLASAAWHALRAPDPRGIERVAAGDTAALPYLRGALVRHLEEFPSLRDGLGRLQREALAAVAAGHARPAAVFGAVSDMEERPFFGDTTLWDVIDRLAAAPHPALRVDGPGPLPHWSPPADMSAWCIAVTDAGRALLDGRADWVALNGIARWQGGVRLSGARAAWRWDAAAGRLAAAPSLP